MKYTGNYKIETDMIDKLKKICSFKNMELTTQKVTYSRMLSHKFDPDEENKRIRIDNRTKLIDNITNGENIVLEDLIEENRIPEIKTIMTSDTLDVHEYNDIEIEKIYNEVIGHLNTKIDKLPSDFQLSTIPEAEISERFKIRMHLLSSFIAFKTSNSANVALISEKINDIIIKYKVERLDIPYIICDEIDDDKIIFGYVPSTMIKPDISLFLDEINKRYALHITKNLYNYAYLRII